MKIVIFGADEAISVHNVPVLLPGGASPEALLRIAALETALAAVLARIAAFEAAGPQPGVAPEVTAVPGITPGAAPGGTSALHVGAGIGNPAPVATWVVQIRGHPDQSAEGHGLINFSDVDVDTNWIIAVSRDNGVGDPAFETLIGTIIAGRDPEPRADWSLIGGTGEITITPMPEIPPLDITGGTGAIIIGS